MTPERMDLVAAAVRAGLRLVPRDRLLHLGCGNGALTARLQPDCAGSLGVDASAFAVSIAQERFAGPGHRFTVQDAVAYAETERDPGRFTKALCDVPLSGLGDDAAALLLRALHRRFPALQRVMLGSRRLAAEVAALAEPGWIVAAAAAHDGPDLVLRRAPPDLDA